MSDRIVLYTATNGSCKPCEEITKLIKDGKFYTPDGGGEVDMVDITTDEGFDRFTKDILSKQDGAVPSAYLEGKKCQIVVEDGVVHFECEKVEPSSALPSDLDEKSTPSETDASHDDAQPGPQDELPSPQE